MLFHTLHLYILFLFSWLCCRSASSEEEPIDAEYFGFSFNNSNGSLNYSSYGLSRFVDISFDVSVDCGPESQDASEASVMLYLFMSDSPVDMDLATLDAILELGILKQRYRTQTDLDELIYYSHLYNWTTGGWSTYLDNTNNTDMDMILTDSWYDIWVLPLDVEQLVDSCKTADTQNSTIDTNLSFVWPQEQSRLFPVFQTPSAADQHCWNSSEQSNVPLSTPFEAPPLSCFKERNTTASPTMSTSNPSASPSTSPTSNNTTRPTTTTSNTIHYTFLVERQQNLTWLNGFYTSPSSSSGFHLLDDDSNVLTSNHTVSYTLHTSLFNPLNNYTNCETSLEQDDADCPSGTCCYYKDREKSKFDLFFFYDDQVWTNRLRFYRDFCQKAVEEALSDVYFAVERKTLQPSQDFFLEVPFFYGFCLVQGECPSFDAQEKEGTLTFWPQDPTKNESIAFYEMYATVRTAGNTAVKLQKMLAGSKANTQMLLDGIERRMKEHFGRYTFQMKAVAVGELPPVARFNAPVWVSYGLYGFVGMCTLFALAGAIHGFMYWGADCIRISGIVYFGLYTWDFYSDIVFTLDLLNHPEVFFLFYFCVAFIAIPWVGNMISLSVYQKKWCQDKAITERVYSWFVSWQRLTYVLAAISGSAFGTVELVNSYVFGIDFFCMGLNERHLKKFNNNRLWSGILAENVPQLVLQFYFLSTQDWVPDEDFVWLAIASSSLSVGAALLDMYSAKKLFEVLEPKGKSLGNVSCSLTIFSKEVKQEHQRLQISTYALRDVIAEIITTHCRSVEMHFPITTSDGFKVKFTVFSATLKPRQVYKRLYRNCRISHSGTSELARQIVKVWRLENITPTQIPLDEIGVDGVSTDEMQFIHEEVVREEEKLRKQNEQFTNRSIEFDDELAEGPRISGAGNTIELVQAGSRNTGRTAIMNLEEKQSDAMMMLPSDKYSGLNGLEEAQQPLTEQDAKIASLNAQIAMNQYLMMKQIETYVDEEKDDTVSQELQTLMMQQMKDMHAVVSMEKPYDPSAFEEWNKTWQDKIYRPPELSGGAPPLVQGQTESLLNLVEEMEFIDADEEDDDAFLQ